MTGTSDALRANELLDKKIEAAQQATRKVQEETRGMREAAADLRAAAKAAEATLSALRAAARGEVEEILQKAVEDGLKDLGTHTVKYIDGAKQGVYDRFDALSKLLLGEGQNGEKSISELIDDLETLFHFKWDVFVHLVKTARLENDPTGTCSKKDCGNGPVLSARIKGTETRGHAHLCMRHHAEMRDAGWVFSAEPITFEHGVLVCAWPEDHGQIRPFSSVEGVFRESEIVNVSIRTKEEMEKL